MITTARITGILFQATWLHWPKVGIEVNMPHGTQHATAQRICVDDIHEVRIACIQATRIAAEYEQRLGGIQSRDALQLPLQVVRRLSGHLSTQAEADDVQQLELHYAALHKIIDQLRQALADQGEILHCLHVARISHEGSIVNGHHIDILVIQQCRTYLIIGCKVTISRISMENYLHWSWWLKVPRVEIEWIQFHGCIACGAATDAREGV